MRLPRLLVAALLWQSATVVNIGTVAAPEHLRFARPVLLPAGATGLACAALDAQLLAHTASPAHNDVRLFRGYPGQGIQVETPYYLTESGPEPVDASEATVEHLVRSGDELRFDLRMPARAYSEVQLRLRLHDFVGTVVVSGTDAHGNRQGLGIFPVFDLSGERLGHSTHLALAETSDPILHVSLWLRTTTGQPVLNAPFAVIAGASVPPSRLRQTLFTPIASTQKVVQTGFSTVAVLHVPAHVPVERVSFEVAPEAAGNYSRDVLVRARPEGDANGDTEVIDAGAIQHLSMPSGDPRLNAIDVTEDSLDATLGATLASNAVVRVVVQNRGQRPLPIRSVTLQMRRRSVCFLAIEGTNYTLRYGDAALAAPVYDETAFPDATATPIQARLGGEQRNPQWRPREDTRRFLDRHPEVFWVIVLACAGMMGATALQYIEHREGGVRS